MATIKNKSARKRRARAGGRIARLIRRRTRKPTRIEQAHDRFFKLVFSNPLLAWLFLKWAPGPLAGLISDEMPEVLKGDFVTARLGELRTDLVLRVRLITGDDLIVVLEHKSRPDPLARLQLKLYGDEAQNYLLRSKAQLLGVYTIILYQGNRRKWGSPSDFFELLELPAALGPYLPSWQHVLVDLTAMGDDDLPQHPYLRALLMIAKYSGEIRRNRNSPNLAGLLASLVADLVHVEKRDEQRGAIMYIESLVGSSVAIRAALNVLPIMHKEAIMDAWARQHREVGRKEGREQGREEGREEGLEVGRKESANMLAELLEDRFGRLPPNLRSLVLSADLPTLKNWYRTAFKASDLRSVFGERLKTRTASVEIRTPKKRTPVVE